MDDVLKKLLRDNPSIWCASASANNRLEGLSTGFEKLDAILPVNGWPVNSLVEVLLPRWGIGELQLLLPALVALSQQKKWIVWVSPPFIPYAPALAHAGVDLEWLVVMPKTYVGEEVLWATEKILRNRSCGMVLSWPSNAAKLNDKAMRRLQLAAEEGQSTGFIFRGLLDSAFSNSTFSDNTMPVSNVSVSPSPAALRFSLSIVDFQLQVCLLKARGASRLGRVLLDVGSL